MKNNLNLKFFSNVFVNEFCDSNNPIDKDWGSSREKSYVI